MIVGKIKIFNNIDKQKDSSLGFNEVSQQQMLKNFTYLVFFRNLKRD